MVSDFDMPRSALAEHSSVGPSLQPPWATASGSVRTSRVTAWLPARRWRRSTSSYAAWPARSCWAARAVLRADVVPAPALAPAVWRVGDRTEREADRRVLVVMVGRRWG